MHAELILFANHMSEVLVAADASGKYALPVVPLDSACRHVEMVSKCCWEKFSVDIYCFFFNEIDAHDGGFTAIARTLTDSPFRNMGMYKWLPVSRARQNAHLKSSLDASLQRLNPRSLGQEIDVFGNYGWLDTFTKLFQTATGGSIEKFRQFNAGPFFSLINLETEQEGYWFKAVGSDNIREYQATHYLHRHFPGFVPSIVSSYPEWNGWLSTSVEGQVLASIEDSHAWHDVFARYAEMQTCSIAHLDNLTGVGAVPWTVRRMSDSLDEFFDGMPAIMSRQLKESPARLSPAELRQLRWRMEAICLEMQSLGIPDTIFHGDLCPENIIISQNGPVFLDWAEMYIGNPFLGAELLLCYFRNHFAADEAEIRSMQEAFNGPWLSLLSRESMARAWQLATCLAPLLNALYMPSVSTHSALPASKQDAYSRTLVRLMKRESDCLEVFACR